MYIKELQKESEDFKFGKSRNLIKPFTTFDQVWLLLQSTEFKNALRDTKFYFFIRKKIFWVLDQNFDNTTMIQFKGIIQMETSDRIISIADQILLTYFSEDLHLNDLEGIIFRMDEYNSLTAYRISSARGTSSKSNSN